MSKKYAVSVFEIYKDHEYLQLRFQEILSNAAVTFETVYICIFPATHLSQMPTRGIQAEERQNMGIIET